MAWCFCDKTEIKTKKIMEESLAKKIDAAIKLLQSTCKDEVVELCYSGGKDSDVILQLAKEAGIKYRAIYRCTTIDPHSQQAMVRHDCCLRKDRGISGDKTLLD